tara:strand:- start:1522 stop:3291 length:1770 start_codon:yes stop_codon:yes gene_type:complete
MFGIMFWRHLHLNLSVCLFALGSLPVLGKSSLGMKSIEDSLEKNAVTQFIHRYTDFYKNYKSAFSPYETTRDLSPEKIKRTILSSMCEGLEKFCSKNKIFMEKSISAQINSEFVEDFNSSRINNLLDKRKIFYSTLQAKFKNLKTIRQKELENILQEGFFDEKDLYKKLEESREQVLREAKKDFFKVLLKDLKGSKDPIFLTNHMLKMISGLFYDIEETDIIIATKEIEKKMRDWFAFFINQPVDVKKKLLTNFELSYFLTEKKDYTKNVEKSLFSKIFEETGLDLYSQKNTLKFHILKNYNAANTDVFHLLLKREYQRAVWLLRENGFDKQANSLENIIQNDLISPEKLVKHHKLGLGFTKTIKTYFFDGVEGIYKPEVKYYENPVINISSNYKAEILAYKLDKLIGLNMVPITSLVRYGRERKGSQQYFLKNAYRARTMRSYDGVRPQKFSQPLGRNKKLSSILFFDWLISNYDRNSDNYMILKTGKFFLIDHGFTMFDPFVRKIKVDEIKLMMPTRKIFRQLEKLSSDPEIVRFYLKDNLSENQLKLLQKKINYFFIKGQAAIKKFGADHVFEIPDKQQEVYKGSY